MVIIILTTFSDSGATVRGQPRCARMWSESRVCHRLKMSLHVLAISRLYTSKMRVFHLPTCGRPLEKDGELWAEAGKWSLAQGVGPKDKNIRRLLISLSGLRTKASLSTSSRTVQDIVRYSVRLHHDFLINLNLMRLPPSSPPLRPPCWPQKGRLTARRLQDHICTRVSIRGQHTIVESMQLLSYI